MPLHHRCCLHFQNQPISMYYASLHLTLFCLFGGAQRHFQRYFSYIVEETGIPQTYHKSLTNYHIILYTFLKMAITINPLNEIA